MKKLNTLIAFAVGLYVGVQYQTIRGPKPTVFNQTIYTPEALDSQAAYQATKTLLDANKGGADV